MRSFRELQDDTSRRTQGQKRQNRPKTQNDKATSREAPSPTMAAAATNSASEVEETLARIRSHKGVEGVIIMNREGATLQTTLSEEQTAEHAAMLSQLTTRASNLVRDLDPTDELSMLRVRSRNREIMIAPDKEFILIVIQNPHIGESS